MKIDRKHIEEVFEACLSRYDENDVKIRLKKEHTERVAALCEQIARSLNLSQEDVDLAWALGIFHDLGRFVQVDRYGTFNDALSANHAALSGDLLFQEGKIRDYIADPSEDELIEKAVRLHNVYELPAGLSTREKMFADILRDADKIDILKVNYDTPLEEIYDVPEKEFRQAVISEPVMADIRACRLVQRKNGRTVMDAYVSHIAFVFGLVYPESVKEMKREGYLDILMAYPSENETARRQLSEIRNIVHEYMDKRIRQY